MSDVDDSPQNDAADWSRPSFPDAIDLLDLVRSTEEGATIATSSPDVTLLDADPASEEPEELPAGEEFVDVGDEAVFLPPSLPPMRAAEPAAARTASLRPAKAAISAWHPRPIESNVGTPMHPAIAIAVIVAATFAALYGLLALPSLF